MTWVVGTESNIVTENDFKNYINPSDLFKNDTILYQYFDAFGAQGTGETMPSELNNFLDSFYHNGKQYLYPLFAFCDIGSDTSYGNLNIPWSGGNSWWTEQKYELISQNKDKYGLPDTSPGYIASPSQVPVMINGGAGQWASSNTILKTIGNPGNRQYKIILSFGGQLVPMANLHNWNNDILAQNLVNIVVKYGFDGIDFDLEGYDNSINGQSDIIWTANLYGNVKRYFLNYEKFINENTNLGYPSNYNFLITDAPQPGYFRNIYWNAQAKTSEMPKSDNPTCVCNMNCQSNLLEQEFGLIRESNNASKTCITKYINRFNNNSGCSIIKEKYICN